MKFHLASDLCLSRLSYSLLGAFLLFVSMPGSVGWWPFLFIALVPLLLSVHDATPLRGFLLGFSAGFLYHCLLLYWIVIVLSRYGSLPLWLAFGGLFILAAYMALYTGLFCWLFALLAKPLSLGGYFPFYVICSAPFLWVAVELIRGTLLTGFPWLDLGYGLHSQPYLIQAADLGGHYLLSFAIVACNSIIAWPVLCLHHRKKILQHGAGIWITIAIFLVFSIFGYSFFRYVHIKNRIFQTPHVQVAAVQGNIDQSAKWSPENKIATLTRYLSLSRQVDGKPGLIVWPETALPFYPQRDPATNLLLDFVRSENKRLLTGAPIVSSPKTKSQTASPQYYNGALLFSPPGEITGIYAKRHLVPFGEYVPARRFLPFISPLVESVGDFTPGSFKGPLILDELKIGMLICYESIFPDIARDSVSMGANLLVNITNDAWYGRSSAPYQSMAMAVFRAVETKRTLVRAANTGISGFVDPLGRVMQQTPIFTTSAINASVPLFSEITWFCSYGHWFSWSCLALVPVLFVMRHRLSPVKRTYRSD